MLLAFSPYRPLSICASNYPLPLPLSLHPPSIPPQSHSNILIPPPPKILYRSLAHDSKVFHRRANELELSSARAMGSRATGQGVNIFANINIDLVCFNVVCATTLGSIKCVVHVSKVCHMLAMVGYSSCIPVDTTSGASNKCHNSKGKTAGRPMPYLGQSLTTPKLQSTTCTCSFCYKVQFALVVFVTKYILHL